MTTRNGEQQVHDSEFSVHSQIQSPAASVVAGPRDNYLKLFLYVLS